MENKKVDPLDPNLITITTGTTVTLPASTTGGTWYSPFTTQTTTWKDIDGKWDKDKYIPNEIKYEPVVEFEAKSKEIVSKIIWEPISDYALVKRYIEAEYYARAPAESIRAVVRIP